MALRAQQYGPPDVLRKFIDLNLDYQNIRSFLGILHASNVRANDWEAAVKKMPSQRGSFQGGELLQTASARDSLSKLPESEKAQLKEHYFTKLNAIVQTLPGLKSEFPEQFPE